MSASAYLNVGTIKCTNTCGPLSQSFLLKSLRFIIINKHPSIHRELIWDGERGGEIKKTFMPITFVLVFFMEFCISFSFMLTQRVVPTVSHFGREMTRMISIHRELHHRTFVHHGAQLACSKTKATHRKIISNPKPQKNIKREMRKESCSCVKNGNFLWQLQHWLHFRTQKMS
jgi:hypothetical protein